MNARDSTGHTALSLAIKEELYYVSKVLIYCGADVNAGIGISKTSCLLRAVLKL